MKVEEPSRLSRKELRAKIRKCLEMVSVPGADRGSFLAQAQIYIQELDHRSDYWVSLRDLILEVIVIALILWEIHMGYRQQTHEDQAFETQKTIWTSMQTSSDATAKSLVSVKDVLGEMKISLNKQVQLYYDVQTNVIYNEASKKLVLINSGRGNITVWSQSLGEVGTPMTAYKKPVLVAPNNTLESQLEDFIKQLIDSLPKGQTHAYRFTYFVKNERQESFTISGDLTAMWHGDAVIFTSLPGSTLPGWKQ
jgi:hypothetical protein